MNEVQFAGQYTDTGKPLDEAGIKERNRKYGSITNTSDEVKTYMEEKIEQYEEKQAAEWAEYLKKKKEKKVDLFGRKAIKLRKFDDPTIVIEMGKTAEDTIVRTIGGEELQGILKMSLDVDPERLYNTVTLTFISPKVVGRKDDEDNQLPAKGEKVD